MKYDALSPIVIVDYISSDLTASSFRQSHISGAAIQNVLIRL
jgi:hypothetical protein